MYGHVKYFHPSDEAREIDWDKLAVHGVNSIVDVQSDLEMREALEVLFIPIAPTVTIHESNPSENQFLSAYLETINTDTTGLKTIAWQHKGVFLGTDRQPYRSSRTHRSDFNLTRELTIYQILDASLLSGKELRFSISVRSLIQEGKAELIVVTENQNVISKEIEFDENKEWSYEELRADIEENSGILIAGLKVQGDTDLYIDKLKLEYRKGLSDWTTYPLKNPELAFEAPEVLESWEINRLGIFEYRSTDHTEPLNKSFRIISKPKLFSQTPSVGETAVQQINETLWSEVPLALYGTDEFTLPQSLSTNEDIKQIELNKITLDDESLRLANIIIAWNVFQHFYPYFDVVDVDWDKVLETALLRALKDQTANEFLKTLQWMVAQLQDGHGVVTCQEATQLFKPPIRVDELEGEFLVTASQVDEITVGDIVKSIDGISARQELNNRLELVSGSPQLRGYRALNMFAAGYKENQAIFELEKVSGKTETVRVSRTSTANLFSSMLEFDYSAIEMIDDDIYLINLRKITRTDFEEHLGKLSSAKGIIFDYRNGSNSSFSLFDLVPHLTDKEVQSPNWYIPELIYPDRRNIKFDYSTWNISPKLPHIKGEKVIINSPGVVSSGETLMSIIDHYELATLIGNSTAGTNGNTNYIDLPGSCRIMWTGMKVLKHDDSQLHLKGYKPAYFIKRSIKAVRDNRDEYLEKAIEVIIGNAN